MRRVDYSPMKPKVKKRNHGLWLLCCSLWLLLSFHNGWRAARGALLTRNDSSSSGKANSGVTGGVKSVCSNQNIETLTTQMLRDLPSYANRTIQRARPPLLSKLPDVYSYMLVAGKPDFTPLPLNPEGYSTDVTKNASPGVEQVFFTTLERLYTSGKAVNLQQFHWLFLTKTKSGWRLVMMFSQTGYYQAKKLPTPPQDSSNGDIAQAINIWLRDCQAAKVGVHSGFIPHK